MPKRSNAFQRLVMLINRQLAGQADVSESAMLKDAITSELREVDVLIEVELAGYQTRIAIECVDRKRKIDVTWVEKMLKKHESLPTDKLVLVSQSGFSVTAINKAQFHNTLALSLDTAMDHDWLNKVQRLIVSGIQLRIMGNEIQLDDVLQDATIQGPLVFLDPTGKPGDLIGLIRSDIISSEHLNKTLVERLLIDKNATQVLLAIDISTGVFQDWYIVDSRDKKHKLKWFRMRATIERSKREKKFQHARYADASIAFTFMDEHQKDIIAFVKPKQGPLTAAGYIADIDEKNSVDTILAQYYFIGDKLLLSAVRKE